MTPYLSDARLQVTRLQHWLGVGLSVFGMGGGGGGGGGVEATQRACRGKQRCVVKSWSGGGAAGVRVRA